MTELHIALSDFAVGPGVPGAITERAHGATKCTTCVKVTSCLHNARNMCQASRLRDIKVTWTPWRAVGRKDG